MTMIQSAVLVESVSLIHVHCSIRDGSTNESRNAQQQSQNRSGFTAATPRIASASRTHEEGSALEPRAGVTQRVTQREWHSGGE